MSDPGKSGRDLTPDEARRLYDQVIAGGNGHGGSRPPRDPGCLLVLLRIMLIVVVVAAVLGVRYG